MIRILSKIFIKNSSDYENADVRKGYGTLTGIVGIFLNICLFAGKFIAGFISGAISITADAFNNLSDAGSALISLLGFRMAYKEPDADHPYGHGRMEYITGLIVSMMIILMGFELMKTSFKRIFNPEELDASIIAIVILVVSILVKIYMNCYNRYYGKKLNAASMKATALDSLSDSVATGVVLMSVLISKFTGVNIDAYTGILVSGFILFAGIRSVKDTISPLLGEPPDKEFVKKIHAIVKEFDNIVGIHDLVVHDYGPGRRMISFHGEVPEDGNINELHEMIDSCERRIREELGCETIIHMDPIAVNDETVNALKKEVISKIKEYDEKISIHDFRIVVGPNNTNVIFDAVLPMGSKKTAAEVKEHLQQIVRSLPGNCFGVIDIDRQYAEWED